MKLSHLGTVLCALGLCTSAFAATEGTINFTGEVINSSCELDTGYENYAVTLPPVPKSALDAVGKSAGEVAFNVKFKNCAPGDVIAAFAPSQNQGNLSGEHIKNAATGTGENAPATGVDIALFDANGIKIDLSARDAKSLPATPTPITDGAGGNVTINLTAKYIATAANVTAGKVSGLVRYQIEYQ